MTCFCTAATIAIRTAAVTLTVVLPIHYTAACSLHYIDLGTIHIHLGKPGGEASCPLLTCPQSAATTTYSTMNYNASIRVRGKHHPRQEGGAQLAKLAGALNQPNGPVCSNNFSGRLFLGRLTLSPHQLGGLGCSIFIPRGHGLIDRLKIFFWRLVGSLLSLINRRLDNGSVSSKILAAGWLALFLALAQSSTGWASLLQDFSC